MSDNFKKLASEFPELSAFDGSYEDLLVKIFSNIKYLKGDKGDTPTEEELLTIIKPLIPSAIVPSDEQLLQLIRPLIPAIKDGKTPTKDELIALIRPLIPDPIPGEDGEDADYSPEIIADKLNTLEGAIDSSVIKGAVVQTDLDKYKGEVFDGMAKIDGRIKAIDQRWRGGGLSKVLHDSTLTGDGTSSSPLKVTTPGGTPGGVLGDIQINNPLGTFGVVGGARLNVTGNTRGTTALDLQSDRTAVTQVASGTRSTALGNRNTASGLDSTAVGTTNTASASYSTAIGAFSSATNNNATAIGSGSGAAGQQATAIGYGNSANGTFSTAVGSQNSSTADYSSSFGYFNSNSGPQSTASGYHNEVGAANAGAFGYQNTVDGAGSYGIGIQNTVSAYNSLGYGISNQVLSPTSFTFGYGNIINAGSLLGINTAIGYGNSISNDLNQAYGINNIVTSASGGVAIGGTNTVSGSYALGAGFHNLASGKNSSAVGFTNTASGIYTSVSGYKNTASSTNGNAFGFMNQANGSNDDSAFGRGNIASGAQSSAFGYVNTAQNANAAAFGQNNNASGSGAIAFGTNNTSSANNSVAVGNSCTASANYSSAFGSSVNNGTASTLQIGASDAGKVTVTSPGVVKIRQGLSSSTANAVGIIFDHFADANNSGTSETDLYTDTTVASALGTNGDKFTATYQGIFTGAAAATQELRVYFGGTKIYDSGALSIGIATNNWTLNVLVIRESSSVVRCSVGVNSDFATLFPYSAYTRITGLTLTNTQILKITGQAAGAGGASNQITAKLGYVEWKSAA